MSGAEDKLAIAEAQARDAKARLDETLVALRERVDPRAIAKNAAEGLREQGEAAAAVAQRNPGVAMAALGAVGLLLIRRPVMALFRRKNKPVRYNARRGSKGFSR